MPVRPNAGSAEPSPNEKLLTAHIAAMKPTVPQVRIGGNAFTKSRPLRDSVVNATVFDSAIVGM